MIEYRGEKIPRKKANLRKAIITVLLSLAICAGVLLLFVRENISGVIHEIASANLMLVLLAIGLFFMEVALWTGRWKTALNASGYHPGFGLLYMISYGSQFLTNITPISKTGGEPFRAYFAKKIHHIPYETGFGTIITDALMNVPPFVAFLLIGLVLWFPLKHVSVWSTFGVVLGLAIFAIIFLPVMHKLLKRETASRSLERLVGWVARRLGQKRSKRQISNSVKRFYASSRFAMEHKKAAATMLGFAFLLLSTTVVRIYVIFIALGYTDVSWAVPILGATIPLIIGLVPFLPGGLVLVEGSMAMIFIACGVPAPIAVSATIIERGISYVLSTLVGAGMTSYLGAKMWKL